jgi:hypothetical protein
MKVVSPATQNKLCQPLASFTPDPYNGRVLCALLAAAVHHELLALCNAYGRFLPFVSALPPLRLLTNVKNPRRISRA